jgi:hypothetical protein
MNLERTLGEMNGLQFDWSQLYAVADLTPNEQEMVESA